MKRMVLILFTLSLFSFSASAQKKMKPWPEWSLKEAQQVLDDSPWGQTQIEVDTREMFYTPTAPNARDERRTTQGATNQSVPINYHIRFLSARPIRQALARVIEVQQPTPNPALVETLRHFANQTSKEWVVVAVSFASPDQRFAQQVSQAFSRANSAGLKNTTYLERKDGKRLFLQEYVAPINDGMGAKFVFPRLVEGEPFISASSGEVRFYSEVAPSIKLNMRFKLADMIYDGQLEY